MVDENEGTSVAAGSPAAEPQPPNLASAQIEAVGFPIVGIGASAGGLEALEEFFAHLPPDTGMAFVIVTHLLPDRISLLPELLGKRTGMPVHEVITGMPVEPNHVYLSPPGMQIALLKSTLQLMRGGSTYTNPPFPIDYFFRSLADDQKDRAICIVLSGTGTDGTLGIQAVKGAGGMTMVQEEQSAKFTGMPRSAMATGLVDYVLPADQMPRALVTFVAGPCVPRPRAQSATTERAPD